MFFIYAFLNGLVVIMDFIIKNFALIILGVMALVFIVWEFKANSDDIINDQRRLL